MAPKRISIFGSTGSIGCRTLDVVRDFPGELQVATLAAGRNAALLREQIAAFRPAAACLADPALAGEAEGLAREFALPVFSGAEGLMRLAGEYPADMAVMATVGFAGLLPSMAAMEAGADLALANKEVLVCAGEIVMRRAHELGRRILPIDSEHNAIFQCLNGNDPAAIRRIILTASGGPFRRASHEDLAGVTVEQALDHPTWDMGPKITIDSSTLMNKGFEAIEAHHLFGVPMERIEVVIHPQSTIHSMVEFVDASILAQLGPTDMYLPIQNVLMHPRRLPNPFRPLDLAAIGQLDFAPPDLERFPCLELAYRAASTGGTLPAVLNAANEVAVARFLHNDIGYLDIPAIVRQTMESYTVKPGASLDAICAADAWARERAAEYGV